MTTTQQPTAFRGPASLQAARRISAWSVRRYGKESETSQRGTKLRLMPLGGSVTFGQGSTDGNGYRCKLRELLMADGFKVDMVGSRKVGALGSAHEGWRGFRVDQIDQKARKSVPVHMPNVFTVNAGSNDCLQDFEIDRIGDRMGRLMDYLWAAAPRATIILSTLLVNADERTERRILKANDRFQILAQQKISEHRRLVLADMHGSDGPRLDELVDGTHPNDEGYGKMATIWHRAIREAVQKGFI
ncbi:Multidomain esterase [Colletotrichum fructicola]|uniref:Gdsl-like lipase acylhydrolase n=1 Tax=Colletotrichum fructicola (strain Nara gc5) TaxID=1213859 RepID=L2G5G9_COLFN|nr:Multidomain esterase [Colletotrichum fructicola]